MAKSKTVNIWKIFEILSRDFTEDLHETDKEKRCEDQELRQWMVNLIKCIKNLITLVKKGQFLKKFLCAIQLMVTVFAAVSVTWSAALNLAILGLTGYVFTFAVASIMTMSLYVCLLTAFQNLSTQYKEKEIMRYQKLRMVEIKLFRSPDMPDIESGKTKSLVEYMGYYVIEKKVYKAIDGVNAYNARIDDQLLKSVKIPIELRARMAFAMSARMSAESSMGQRRISRLIRSEYINLYDDINRDSEKDTNTDDFIRRLYTEAGSENISKGFIRESCSQREVKSTKEWVAKVIVMHSLCRFAFFAKKYGDELSAMLEKEKNSVWMGLSREEKEAQKLKAFRWSIKQNLKRQNKKVSNAFTGYFFFIQIALPCFFLLSAILPAGFGILASSPVTKIVSMLGRGMESQLCIWFWLCGAANYLISSRKEVGKVWRKIFELISKKIIQKESSNPEIEKHTLRFSMNMAFRFLIAVSMAYASTLFMKAGVSQILDTPSLVGGDLVFALLFVGWMPWLKPLLLPLCSFLSMIGTVLSYCHVAKYYADKHIPRPKRGKVCMRKQTGWKRSYQRLLYLYRHNFDFKKNRVSRILKLIGSLIAILQTMVFYVSAAHMVGSLCAMLLMPSVLLIISATNRKNIDSGIDLYHLYCNQQFFNTSLSQNYPGWFTDSANTTGKSEEPKEGIRKRRNMTGGPLPPPPRLVRLTRMSLRRREGASADTSPEEASDIERRRIGEENRQDQGASSHRQIKKSGQQRFHSPERQGTSSKLAEESPTGVADEALPWGRGSAEVSVLGRDNNSNGIVLGEGVLKVGHSIRGRGDLKAKNESELGLNQSIWETENGASSTGGSACPVELDQLRWQLRGLGVLRGNRGEIGLSDNGIFSRGQNEGGVNDKVCRQGTFSLKI